MTDLNAILDEHTRARALALVRWPGCDASSIIRADLATRAALAEFLEDTVTRALPVRSRTALRCNARSAEDIREALNAYGESLRPKISNLGSCAMDVAVDALLERAVACAYEDTIDSGLEARSDVGRDDSIDDLERVGRDDSIDDLERVSKKLKLSTSSEDALGALGDDDGANALEALARALGLDCGAIRAREMTRDDAIDLLERCADAYERFVVPFASDEGANAARRPPTLGDLPSGVGLGSDPVVDDAARVARVLHVNDLRRLQSDVDAMLVSMQEYTADPKTDSKIGRIGK